MHTTPPPVTGLNKDIYNKHLILLQGQNSEICGGYSDVAWTKTNVKGKYVQSDKAFLFSLVNPQEAPPMRFPIVKKMFAICYHPE